MKRGTSKHLVAVLAATAITVAGASCTPTTNGPTPPPDSPGQPSTPTKKNPDGQQPVTMTITNNSGASDDMRIYYVGTVGQGSKTQGYLDEKGNFTAFPDNKTPQPQPIKDFAIKGPKQGESIQLVLPYWFSGRIYYSFNAPVPFSTAGSADGETGLVQPAPWTGAPDLGGNIDFDWAELTYSEWGLYLNSTQVDMVARPAVVTGVGEDGKKVQAGGIKKGDFNKIINSVDKMPLFRDGIQKGPDGQILRLVAPTKVKTLDGYLDPYIAKVWQHYSTNELVVRPEPTKDPELTYRGKVQGDAFVFTKERNGRQITINKPSTADAWGCEGTLVAAPEATPDPADKEDRGLIARSICADINRGVLGSYPESPVADASKYYQKTEMNGGLYNHYSAEVHKVMPKAYGFAFDDVGGHESLVHAVKPVEAGIEVIPTRAD